MIPPAGAPRVREYVRLLKNSWLLLLVTTLACAAVSWFAWHKSEPEYQSTASLFVRTEGSASPLDAYYGELDMLTQRIAGRADARAGNVQVVPEAQEADLLRHHVTSHSCS